MTTPHNYRRITPRATSLVPAAALTVLLGACSQTVSDAGAGSSSASSAARSHSTTRSTSSASTQGSAITDADVIGTWVNHHDPELQQEIRFSADHTWSEDQHGTKDIYHGTWEITGDRTVMLHNWEEELRFTPGNNREFTVVSFDHVLTKNAE